MRIFVRLKRMFPTRECKLLELYEIYEDNTGKQLRVI